MSFETPPDGHNNLEETGTVLDAVLDILALGPETSQRLAISEWRTLPPQHRLELQLAACDLKTEADPHSERAAVELVLFYAANRRAEAA